MFATRPLLLACLVATSLVSGAAAQMSCSDSCGYSTYAPAFCPSGWDITGCCYRNCRVDVITTYTPSGHRRQQEAGGNASNYTITTVNNTAIFHHLDEDPHKMYAGRRLQDDTPYLCTFVSDGCELADIAVSLYTPAVLF